MAKECIIIFPLTGNHKNRPLEIMVDKEGSVDFISQHRGKKRFFFSISKKDWRQLVAYVDKKTK
jgi:hypothetical protein